MLLDLSTELAMGLIGFAISCAQAGMDVISVLQVIFDSVFDWFRLCLRFVYLHSSIGSR
jgi:hypothetical protein